MDLLFKIIGALGLVLITIGVLAKGKKPQDLFFIGGGVFLEIYSIFLGDLIFIVLQLVFVVAAVFNLFSKRK
ncbi:MAG: hypothetical protein ABIC95_06835 [archaeon]